MQGGGAVGGYQKVNNDVCLWQPLAVGLGLAAVAAAVSYFALTYGFPLFDRAHTSLDTFKAGLLLFTGASFGFVALANVCFGVYKSLLTEGEEYTNREMKYQIGGTLLAPIGALAICFVPIVMCAAGGKRPL
jgi:hypothetical protein